MATKIDLKRIRTDLDTQIRVDWNEEAVREYAELMESGTEFPPILLFYDEPNDWYILADGFHRLEAHRRVMPNDPILAETRLGDVEAARWAAIIANQSHGIRRTNADKRNAVKRALLHTNGESLSDNQIAKKVGVHHDTVGKFRRELELTCEIRKSDVRIGLDGRTINTAKIGLFKQFLPEDARCMRCVCYKEPLCTNDNTQKLPWDEACEDFSRLVDDVPRRELPPPDYDNIVIADEKKARKLGKGIHQNRRLKGCLKVYLPSDNPSLFAVELRNRWSPGYLVDCIAALKQLLNDDE